MGVRIPKAFAISAGLQEGVEVEIGLASGQLVLTPVARTYGIEELVAGITSENQHRETDWGKPVGNEMP